MRNLYDLDDDEDEFEFVRARNYKKEIEEVKANKDKFHNPYNY